MILIDNYYPGVFQRNGELSATLPTGNEWGVIGLWSAVGYDDVLSAVSPLIVATSTTGK
jgi:hypothetical protein